jgi:hypothetical protein
MKKSEYEWLINKGFKIIRIKNDRIEIKRKQRGWTDMEPYSYDRWIKLLYDNYTLHDTYP